MTPARAKASSRKPTDRIVGSLMLAAIGDALGHPTEFKNIADIDDPNAVRGYTLFWERDGKRFAPYTDDTQMSEAALRALLDTRARRDRPGPAAYMRAVAGNFVRWSVKPQGGHRAPGSGCMAGCRQLGLGVPWHKAGGEGMSGGGCGSAMRAHVFALFQWNNQGRAVNWAAEQSKITHRDPIALAASAAMGGGIAACMWGGGDPNPFGVIEWMVASADGYDKTVGAAIRLANEDALRGVEPRVALDARRGWDALTAVAAAAYIFTRHTVDPLGAVLEGANTPGDSDSIASMAGALVGANVGFERVAEAMPELVRDLERSDELLALARRI